MTIEQYIGYSFKNQEFLQNALTHPSWGKSKFELLEFMGDRVISLVVAEILWYDNPVNEQTYSSKAASLTQKDAILQAAQLLHLGEYVLWRGAPSHSDTILGDACEAVIGAMYLDGGLEPAADLIKRLWSKLNVPETVDPKMALQNWCNHNNLVPRYLLVSESGKPHAKMYEIELTVGLKTIRSTGSSIKSAEKHAAKKFLDTYANKATAK